MLRLTIVQRVLLGFIALLISITILGGSAFNRLASVSSKLNESYTDLMPLLLETQEVPVQLSALRGLTNEYLLQGDEEKLPTLATERQSQYERLLASATNLEQDINRSLSAHNMNFDELYSLLASLDSAQQQLFDLADDARELDASIQLSRQTFYRVWQTLGADMLRLQDGASRTAARRIRSFDRAGAPVLEIMDEAIQATDQETFESAIENLRNIEQTMAGYIEQVAAEDERKATPLDSYRNRLTSYLSGDGSLVGMMQERLSMQAQLNVATAEYDSITTNLEAWLNQAVAAVQRHTDAQEQDASRLVAGANTLIISLLVGALLFATLIAYGLVRSIRRSLVATSAVLDTISNGNFTVSVDTKRQDEFAKLGAVVNVLTQKLSYSIAKVAEVAETLQQSAHQSRRMAAETKQDTLEQKLQADSIATAINELESTVAEIANASNEARELVRTMGGYANEGGRSMSANAATISDLDQQVTAANKVMEELSGHSQQITSVLDVISAIAEQTNLLALNAAIEAARAGESGRGFAVVADEVRSLADKTRQSTVEIKSMIDKLIDSSNQVSKIMTVASKQMQQCVVQTEETQRSIANITNAVGQVESMSEQIAEAANQQTEAVQEISRNVVQVAELADRSAGRADEGVAGSEQVEALANEQKQLVAQFTYQ